MATQHTIVALEPAAESVGRSHREGMFDAVADYWALTKPEVNFLILITTLAGFFVASPPGVARFQFALISHTLLGTFLVAGGTGALNQYIERFFDAQMRRTARRPVASGRVRPSHALFFGILLSLAGVAYLALAVNVLVCSLAVLTLTSYLFLYTPLKRKTPLCTLVGAFPGAVPPLMGWAAARGRLDYEAWLLYAIVFLWQFPHFMAIAWIYREDYSRAGYRVLPRGEQRDRFVFWQTVLVSLVLIPLSLIPTVIGKTGLAYSLGAFILGSGFFYYNACLALRKSNVVARRLMLASIIYLPLVFVLMMLDKA